MAEEGTQDHQKSINMKPKVDAKSMKNKGCGVDGFSERFGAAKVERIIHFGVPFSWPYSIKNRKTDIQKGIEKMKSEKV